LVLRMGTTSLTVRSVKTPLIMRKHLRSPGNGSSVSSTSLCHLVLILRPFAHDEAV
jgi:hypothetical protein